jgi:molybdate transport system ATP-binding protein
MRKAILEVHDLSVSLAGNKIIDTLNFQVQQGECLAIIGAMGVGKSTLVKALTGHLYHTGEVAFESLQDKNNIEVISRQHRFANLSNTSQFYYQQRFNSFDSDDSQVVYNILHDIEPNDKIVQEVVSQVQIEHVLQSRLIHLSNGEHKRFQIAKALLKKAEWFIFDAPYIGLDIASRENLNRIIEALFDKGKYVIILSDYQVLPNCVNRIGILKHKRIEDWIVKEDYPQFDVNSLVSKNYFNIQGINKLKSAFEYSSFDIVFNCTDLNIKYNEKQILNNVNWSVKSGEAWQLKGHNGSGKSTLLSVFNGDNPQAFANDVIVFDQKKGTGESIWSIKNKVGYISPELHHYFDANNTVEEVVASGLFDTIGLFKRLSESQIQLVSNWLQVIGIDHIAKRYFNTLSDGEQQLTLITRALVKLPPVLILDEPAQGLDNDLKHRFKSFINELVSFHHLTLVYVSHYDEEVPSCVTNKLELAQGRVVTPQ